MLMILTMELLPPKQMLLQMSGPPGVHAQLPAGRAGRAEPVSVLLPHSPPSAPDPCARTGHVITQLSALWMVLGMSGPPGACAHPHVAAAIVIVPAHASSPRMAESLAVAPQSKQSSATLLFAQWTDSGMSGLPGLHALPPAPMAPCREPGSATGHLTGVQSATAAGKRQPTAS